MMLICHHWMQKKKSNRWGLIVPTPLHHCPWTVYCAHVSDGIRSCTTNKIAQQIQSVKHHSVSARTIRRRLQLSRISAGRGGPLLHLILTRNRQWCDERRAWTTE
ncbi:hypothetical protein TNCV_545011 [Trichonephila clavipes]|nr:hypothetical protein TNCV_545011 [Trichonephila clavipes]